ncbi:separase [Cynara cardunculus var. scolymus]|uniref:separase n=1 Tax=Cynara cardunculus var. scolymus TaxID=59895 RepID=UPI000D62D948|nr:separase [Cynara cardunculus var. scolymus]
MEDSATITESSLLSELQFSTDLSSIHHRFSSYLDPFSAVLNKPKKHSKSSKIEAEASTIIRSLAKKFLPFLSKSLSILPKRLNETPKIDSSYASELFETYRLCLSCLDAVSSQLSCKPHSVQIQRVRLIHCYENWGKYEDAQDEGFSVLEFIGKLSGKKSGKLRGRLLPELGKDNDDKDVAMLILEVVVTLVKCVSNARSKNEESFHRVLSIVKEIQELRIIDADAHEKLHRMLATYLSKCALFLVGELASFDGKLAHEFCLITFLEFTRSSMNDQMEKFGHRICSSLFSQLDNQPPFSLGILTCVLDAMAHECKVGKEKSLIDFLELVHYCATAIKCRNATVDFCGAVATHFDKLADDFSQVNLSSIMRLYSIILSINDLNSHSRGGNSKMPKAGKDISIPKVLLSMEDQLQRLINTHGSYKLSAEELESTYKALYFTALNFLCEPLSELINSERKDILCGLEDVSLPNIQDAFHQFRLVFLAYGDRQRNVYEDNSRAVLAVASAAFTLSYTTKQNAEESTNFLTHIIKADWVHANGLKFLFASLHNVGIVLYRTNRLKEATESFKLCCEAAWNCVLHFCKMFASSRDGCSSDVSEDVIAGFVTEACAKSAFLLDILHQCGSKEISEILAHYLRSWFVAQSLFAKIPSPEALVKQWVKIECKRIKDPEEAEHRVPTLYSLMSSSEVSKETLGSLLEQELQAYKEMKSLNPKLSKTMQTTITNILLEEIYSTKDSCLQKSRILIAKGMESRACGVEGLNGCINYLSEAISTLSDLYNKSKDDRGPMCYLLAEAYCLRALCTQEAEPNSKHFIQDIDNAVKLWSSPDCSQSAEDMVFQKTLTLLHYVVDLISLKGYMVDHLLIYETMIKFSSWKNVPLNDWLALLWQFRSLSHALCASPINDEFIRALSKHCALSNSVEFWTSCMKRSKSLEVGFRQSLIVISTLSSSHSYIHDHATKADITIDEVKQSASDLIKSVPLSNTSLFLASQLYYDLGESMIARGLMVEAISHAKEAHRLRSKLFHKKFMYSIEQQNDTVGANGEVIQKRRFGLETFHMHSSVATAAWSSVKGSSDFDDGILTPWNILRCYLESTLQIGTLQDIVGNGSEAETLLRWGKDISFFQALPIFLVAFSAALGKLYRKQQLWHLAEKELESAKHILADNCSLISCSKCRLVLEVTVDQQFGDLFRSRFNSTTGNKLYEGLSNAEFFYSSAEENLKLYEWRNCLSNPEEASARNTMFCDALLSVGKAVGISSNCGDKAEHSSLSKISGKETIQSKVTRKNKKTTKPLPQEQRMTSRITRSSKQRSEYALNEVHDDVYKFSDRKQVYACTDALIGKGPQNVDHVAACGCEATCVCDEGKCWHCLPSEVMKSLSLRNIIQTKWECIRRRLLLRVLTGRGKCFGVRGEIQQAHKVFLKSISVLLRRSTFHQSHFSISFTFLAELIEKNVTGDIFAVEHASILYNICWFSLKSFRDNDTRNHDCDSFIPAPVVVSGLKLAFILCREVPMLFQKVSRLLAVLYTLPHSNKAFSMLSSSSNVLSECQWASYFHQASLGTHLNHQLFSSVEKHKDQKTTDVDGSCLPSSISLSRLAPESVLDLEGFVLKFLQGLPHVTIVCISMLGDDFASLLRELLPYNPSTHAWIMLSRFNSDSIPVVIVLPIDYILSESSEEGEDSSSSFLFNKKTSVKSWHCPWGHTIVDEVAPLFKMILEENYTSSSAYPLEDTKKNRLLWWTQRRKLDECLSVFLRDIEDIWFGSWKHLLLGEWLDTKHLDSLQKKLKKDLKSKCKVDVHESILKLVLGGARHASQRTECLSDLILNNGCYVGGIECNNDRSPGECSRKQDSIDSLSLSVSELIINAVHEIEEEDFPDREPVILVPDFDIQMLPWENLPVLRNQEVYRMPSVASISFTYDRCCHYQEKVGTDSAVFPMIDPLDAYYLLNPGGDLSSTEAEFGSWFKDQNLQGTTGTSPTVDELSVALKSHDLFMYFGHGSGVQYIPGDEIQKLDRCAATLLMGCSSGSISLNGCYTPKGAPLYYLHAGSPVIVANLWEVTDKDIDRFGKAMLDACIRTRSITSAGCAQCSQISVELEKLKIDDDKRKGKKKTSKKKSVEPCKDDICTIGCKHRPKIGSFMGQAREACTLPFLIGAAPVCYGVPTGIRKKDLV